jgi:ectoine hydroxylase-related dioxygenase (phytanoyl-CoA dioxygenase family)
MSIDISQLNMPWVESPFFKKFLAESNYSEAEKEILEYFSDNGYYIFDPGISEEKLDAAIEALDGEYRMDGRINETRRVINGWKKHEVIQEIAGAPKVYELLKLLYKRNPLPFQTLNFNIGTEQRTHSDTIHFHCIPHGFMCGVWIALEDVNLDNGPLHIYPGSHKLPYLDLSNIGLAGSKSKTEYEFYGNYEDMIEEVAKASGLERRLVEMKKGQALVWAANLLHGGSTINDKNSTRHSQVTHYYFEDCVYYTPLHSDLVLGKIHTRNMNDVVTGAKIEHKYLGNVVNINNSLLDKIKKRVRRKRKNI